MTQTAVMRLLLSSALWLYFGWYAGSLAAEFVPVSGYLGLALTAAVLVWPIVDRSRSGSAAGRSPAEQHA